MASSYPVLRLKPGREMPIKNRHHAIYKHAFESLDGVPTGSIAEIRTSEDEFLCFATINTRAYIAGRVISFEEGDPLVNLRRTMKRAVELRRQFFLSKDTTAFRLINAEGDSVPGLIVDQYGDTLTMQLTTLGMDRLRTWVADTLQELCSPAAIFEKSTGSARTAEGLEPREGWTKGIGDDVIDVRERGMQFRIHLKGSQKTGLFLDQREMRSLVGSMAAGRTVLDCCSYVGGFSMAALHGGAIASDAVDYDHDAIDRVKEHTQLNGFSDEQCITYCEDVFDFLRRRPLPRAYDFIILDPPAFAKRHDELEKAKHTYTDLNRLAMQALPAGSLLLTCSCSFQITAEIFQSIVFQAARDANRSVRILQRHRQALDHPVNLYHPETEYLKSVLLWIE